ncbi:MAG: trypsin-like peptidase domain-containing protein [Armatimonadetes bacterium]|nr:trypsin-like peptidase domain-containing protein [Armatimonadota bacterium]
MRRFRFIALLAASFIGVLAALQVDHRLHPSSSNSIPTGSLSQLEPVPVDYTIPASPSGVDFRVAARKVLPSVVSVDRFERQIVMGYYEDRQIERETGTGSGVIMSDDGLIVTNNHVVNGADRVRVRTNDKRSFEATVVGADPTYDIAVLRINATNIKPIETGDSDKVEVGQWAVAVGNPLGYSGTVSVGVVSSLGRSLRANDEMEGSESYLVGAIQTDAAINPGNSGGALTDTDGRLIGINSAIASTSGGSIGIGFAIPVNRVRRIVSDIVKYSHPRDAVLGVHIDPRDDGRLQLANFREYLKRYTNNAEPPTTGLLVRAVNDVGPAQKVGLQPADVLLEIDGNALAESIDLRKALADKRPGDSVKLKVWSKGATKEISLTLGEAASH